MLEALSAEVMAAVHQEVARYAGETYGAELASLRNRIEELEAALQSSLGTTFSQKLALVRSSGSGHEATPQDQKSGELQAAPQDLKLDEPQETHALVCRPASEEIIEAPGSLPESLFNYCVERLAISERPWRDPAVGFLTLLTLSQNLLMNGFSQMNFKTMVANHWEPLDKRPKSLMNCVYAETTFLGEPVLFVMVVVVALLIVALVIKQSTIGGLCFMQPDRSTRPGVWLFVNFVWFQQMVFIPAIFSIEAAALLASSEDTSALIMNTLAVTFILEVDALLYGSILDDGQKAEYQALAGHVGRPARTRRTKRASWLMFWGCLLLMCVHFYGIRFFLKPRSGRDFIASMSPFYSSYVIGGGLRAAIEMWATRSQGVTWADVASESFRSVASFVAFAVLTPLWFFAIQKVSQGGVDLYFRSSCFDWIME